MTGSSDRADAADAHACTEVASGDVGGIAGAGMLRAGSSAPAESSVTARVAAAQAIIVACNPERAFRPPL
jgi:hypothetical protein